MSSSQSDTRTRLATLISKAPKLFVQAPNCWLLFFGKCLPKFIRKRSVGKCSTEIIVQLQWINYLMIILLFTSTRDAANRIIFFFFLFVSSEDNKYLTSILVRNGNLENLYAVHSLSYLSLKRCDRVKVSIIRFLARLNTFKSSRFWSLSLRFSSFRSEQGNVFHAEQ